MTTKTPNNVLLNEECHLLASLMDIEEQNYRRLLRLAWRQNSYMKRQDVDRLDFNSREWSLYLPVANKARIARERFVSSVSGRVGIDLPQDSITDLLDYTDHTCKKTVQIAIARLNGTTAKLAKQNEMNRHLAEFCIDLAREETKIFRDCVLDNPSGCYDQSAKTTGRGPGGVLVRQA